MRSKCGPGGWPGPHFAFEPSAVSRQKKSCVIGRASSAKPQILRVGTSADDLSLVDILSTLIIANSYLIRLLFALAYGISWNTQDFRSDFCEEIYSLQSCSR